MCQINFTFGEFPDLDTLVAGDRSLKWRETRGSA